MYFYRCIVESWNVCFNYVNALIHVIPPHGCTLQEAFTFLCLGGILPVQTVFCTIEGQVYFPPISFSRVCALPLSVLNPLSSSRWLQVKLTQTPPVWSEWEHSAIKNGLTLIRWLFYDGNGWNLTWTGVSRAPKEPRHSLLINVSSHWVKRPWTETEQAEYRAFESD